MRELFHRAGTVIDNLQKKRPAGLWHTCQAADNIVVDKFAQLVRRNAAAHVRIKDLQEITEFLAFGFLTKLFEGQQRFAVLLEVIDEGD